MSPSPSSASDRFFAISLDEIEQGSVIPCDLWIQREEGRVVLYRARNLAFDRDHVDRLVAAGVRQLFVSFDDADRWSDYVGDHLQRNASDQDQPLATRLYAVIETSAETMRRVFEDPGAPHAYRSVDYISRAITQLMSEPCALSQAVRLMRHDYYTYTHCLQVSMYAVALAQACGEKNTKTLAGIGRGCLMHDVGKCGLPRELLNKPGRLSAAEWELIQQHPKRGVALLRDKGWEDPVVSEIVACHHERLDGSGYPFRLKGRDISFVARVTAVCDAFDAMTTDRAYERAKRGVEALEIIRTKGRDGYDQQLVDRFIRCLLQPVGEERPSRPAG